MEVELIRSKRKTIAIEIKPDGRVIVRAPFFMKEAQIRQFIKEKEGWIEKHLKDVKVVQKLTVEEVEHLAEEAVKVIPKKVRHYAQIMNLQYGRITIRNQKTRWGSCSGKGNLNFNCLLMLAPEKVIDYVVVHELSHLVEMNHSKAFWQQVESVLPDYSESRQWLKVHGNEIMNRMY